MVSICFWRYSWFFSVSGPIGVRDVARSILPDDFDFEFKPARALFIASGILIACVVLAMAWLSRRYTWFYFESTDYTMCIYGDIVVLFFFIFVRLLPLAG